MLSKIITVKIHRDGSTCFIPIPFDPKAAFGKARAPVKVSLRGHSYRSTIFLMGGVTFIPLRRSHREAAGLDGGERVRVKIELDTEVRKVDVPADFARALKASAPARKRWQALSYTRQREHVEAITGAKKPETRSRRIVKAIAALEA